MDRICYLCLVSVMLSGLFIAALWSPAWKGLTSWLSFVMFTCVFVTYPCAILDPVWYLIISIPDLCHLSYFDMSDHVCVMTQIAIHSFSALHRASRISSFSTCLWGRI